MKILLVSDSPEVTSGLGRLSRYFIRMFPEAEWYVWGINHQAFLVNGRKVKPVFDVGKYNGTKVEIMSPKEFGDDPNGFQFLPSYIDLVSPNFVLTALDFDRIDIADQIKRLSITKGFKWVNYFPMDRTEFHKDELKGLMLPDVNVCISKYGVDLLRSKGFKGEVKQIWHPIDADEFPQVSARAFKRQYYGERMKFLIGTVNRSFARKDPARLIKAMSIFKEKNPESNLYFHGSRKTFEGSDLGFLAHFYDLADGTVRFPEDKFNEIAGVNPEALNKIYRTFNVFTTASTGEGFGFTTVEAMLCEVPIVAPDNTVFPELIGDNGYLVKSNDWNFQYGTYNHFWPTVSIEGLAEGWQHVKDNPEEAKEKAKAGREWVIKNLNLKTIENQWREILK